MISLIILGKKDAFELQLQSNWFQQSSKTICKDTHDNLLVKALQKLNGLFDCPAANQFTTTKYFLDSKKGLERLNARMTAAYPVLMELVKTISPAKEQWAIVPDPLKMRYEAVTPPNGSVPIFKNLEKALVSSKAPFHHINQY